MPFLEKITLFLLAADIIDNPTALAYNLVYRIHRQQRLCVVPKAIMTIGRLNLFS